MSLVSNTNNFKNYNIRFFIIIIIPLRKKEEKEKKEKKTSVFVLV